VVKARVAAAALLAVSLPVARPDPDDAGGLFALARHPNLYLKFTTHNVRDAARPQVFMKQVVEAFGAQRIAWGSNYPASHGSLASLVADARQARTASASFSLGAKFIVDRRVFQVRKSRTTCAPWPFGPSTHGTMLAITGYEHAKTWERSNAL
jgi:hypothetical protein